MALIFSDSCLRSEAVKTYLCFCRHCSILLHCQHLSSCLFLV